MENFFIYGLGGIISRIIPFIMLPVITRLMPDIYYFGINDITNVIVSFGTSFAILGMYDAIFRLFFDQDDINYKISLCSNALFFCFISSTIIAVVIFLLRSYLALYFFKSLEYEILIVIIALSIWSNGVNSILAAPTRMQNKKKTYLFINSVSSVIIYIFAIPLLLLGKYSTALPFTALCSIFMANLIYIKLNYKWFKFRLINKSTIMALLQIALPLLPNFLIYWVFNSCDRLMISKILGEGAVGVYAIGSKLGHLSQLIYTAFVGGWQYFAYSTMKEKDQIKVSSLIFEYLAVISYSSCILMAAFCKYIFEILFVNEYVNGYVVAPYLFLSPLLLMLFQVASSQFIIVKTPWFNLITLAAGAFLNVILNLILLNLIGIEGAALATVCGYLISVFLCLIILKKKKLYIISIRFLIITLVTIVYLAAWGLYMKDNFVAGLFLAVLVICLLVVFYRKDLKLVLLPKAKRED